MSVYRQAPALPYLCPRCGDVLDHVFELVRVCMACEGVWLERAAVTAAFADPQWPAGRAMWWRNTLECPACKLSNTSTQLTAVAVGDVMIDRCPDGHGLFLDRGELGRLMRTQSDELLTLLDLLAQVDGAALEARRDEWKRARDDRRALIARHGEHLAELARQQRHVREAEQAAQAAAGRAIRMAAEARRRAALDAAQRATEREQRIAQRADVAVAHAQLLAQIATAVVQIGDAEVAMLAQRDVHARLVTQAHGLAERISELDAEIAALED